MSCLSASDRLIDHMDDADSNSSHASAESGPECVGENGTSQQKHAMPGLPEGVKENFLAAAAEFSFNGTFAYSHTYSIDETPRPCLNIIGLGSIGLPLSPRDAQSIFSLLEQETAHQGVLSKKSIELPSDRILFDNPAWEDWTQKSLLSAVCAALDVRDVAKQRCRLEKLSLMKEGSEVTSDRILPSEGSFGSVVVILPSPFTGGLLQVSDPSQAKAFDLAPHSALSTSVVAVYAGVDYKADPVLSGYRLALHYSLQSIDEGKSFPRLPEPLIAAAKLRETLVSWKEKEKDEKPAAVLAYLLQSKASKRAQAGSQVLVGCDADLLLYLLPIARELDFEVYLADAKLEVSGSTGLLPSGHTCVCESCVDPLLGPDDSNLKFNDLKSDKFADQKLILQDFIDGDGMPVEISELNLETSEILNSELWRDGTPEINYISRIELEDVEYEYEYNRTILLLWPKRAERVVHVGDVYDYTCNALQLSISPVASPEEKRLIDLLLERCRERQDEKEIFNFEKTISVREKMVVAMGVLCNSAARWNDVQLFSSAVKTCPAEERIELVGIGTFIAALKTFTWATLKDILVLVLAEEGDNERRYELIRRVSEAAKEMNSSEIDEWCEEQDAKLIHSLKTVSINQVDWLLSLVKERGAEFFRDVIVAQLLVQSTITDFWLSFVKRLDKQKGSILSSSPRLVETLISQCVEGAVRTCVSYESKKVQTQTEELFMRVIKLCVSTNNVEKCSALFQNIESIWRAHSPHIHATNRYYSYGSASLDSYLETKPELEAFSLIFRIFFENAAVYFITEKSSECKPADLVMIVKRAGGSERIFKRIDDAETMSALLKDKDTSEIRKLLTLIPSMSQSDEAEKGIARFRNACSLAYVNSLPLSSLHERNGPEELMNIVRSCYNIGAHWPQDYLSKGLLSLLDGCDASKHFHGVLMPFLHLLDTFVAQKKSDLSSVALFDELSIGMAKYIARARLSQVRSTRSTNPVSFGCYCVDCAVLRQFLSSNEQSVAYQKAFNIKNHLVNYLLNTRITQRGVTSTVKKMQQNDLFLLRVSKPPRAILNIQHVDGLRLLGLLGDSVRQKQILGEDYDWTHAAIVGLPLSPADMQRCSQAMPMSTSASFVGQKRPAELHSTNVDSGATALPKKPKLT